MLLGVDVGGTFTDAVLFDGRRVHTAKAPSTPDDQSVGVLAAVDAALERAAAGPAEVRSFAHGMTVGTNALLEERGARTALVATRGFTDLLEIGRQNRPHLYRLCAPKPGPLVAASDRVAVGERVGPEGVVDPLSDDELARVVAAVGETGAESVAVCLLFSYLDPAHERAIATRLRAELPGVHVSASHEVLPRFREYERCSTTVIDAYLSPLLGRYLGRLARRPRAAADCPSPVVMMSLGRGRPRRRGGAGRRVERALGARRRSGRCRPAWRRSCGDGNALGFDMGGTSCDVCVIEDGRVRRTGSREIDGRADPAADGRRAHGRCRRRLDRLARRRRRPAGRAAVGRGRARAGLLRARRRPSRR